MPHAGLVPLVHPGDRGDGDRLPGGDLRRLLDRPPGGRSSATCRACAWSTPPKRAYGQVYVPVINRLLLVAVLALVLDLPDLGQARLRVRDGGDRHDR